MEYIIIFIVVLVIVLIIKNASKKNIDNDLETYDSSKPIKLTVSFPDPEKTTDYRFYKFVQYEPRVTLELLFKELKKRGYNLKPEFEQAIQTKINTGKFENPIDFREYYGIDFDFIGLQFLMGTDSKLSAFQIGFSYIKDEKLLDSETYDFKPPEKILATKKFAKTLETFELENDFEHSFGLKKVWETFDFNDYLNNNLIVFWDEESEILERILKYNEIKGYKIRYIKIREIAQDNGLPDLIDTLLSHFDSDLTLESDLSLIVTALAVEIKESGVDIDKYIHILSESNRTKSIATRKKAVQEHTSANSNDFIALDVETAIGKRWSICQIGLCIVENGVITDTQSYLVQPPNNEYAHWNTKIHGITESTTRDAPFFPEVWSEIYPALNGKKLVAHNAEFDENCLQQTLEYYNLGVPKFNFECTLNKTGLRLDQACEAYEINLENHHDAACDAKACAEINLKITNNFEPDYSKIKLKPKVNPSSMYEGHEKIQGDLLKPDLENADKNSPFYNKKVVFTGILENIGRKEAAQIVKEMGADIDTSITKRTNFVITGKDPGPSKMNKVIKYNNEGSSIKILIEKELLEMINK